MEWRFSLVVCRENLERRTWQVAPDRAMIGYAKAFRAMCEAEVLGGR